jgi:molecular chaperone GrpE
LIFLLEKHTYQHNLTHCNINTTKIKGLIMSDVEKDQVEEALETQGEAEEINESVEVECSPEEALEKANDDIQRLTEYAEEMKEEALRAKAEMENIRKRAERDVQNARKFGIEKFAKELLPVTDSIDQALKHEVKLDEAVAMKEGIEMTSKILIDVLKKNGLEELDPKGEKFDPNMHEALAMIPNPKFEDNTVFEVFQKGYLLNGRVVRAAKVIVVKN